jgi:hypothetical protein
MQTLSFKDINAVMDDSHIQHYVSLLQGEGVLLDVEIQLTVGLRLQVVTIFRKQQFPSFSFLVNYYVSPWPNGISIAPEYTFHGNGHTLDIHPMRCSRYHVCLFWRKKG